MCDTFMMDQCIGGHRWTFIVCMDERTKVHTTNLHLRSFDLTAVICLQNSSIGNIGYTLLLD